MRKSYEPQRVGGKRGKWKMGNTREPQGARISFAGLHTLPEPIKRALSEPNFKALIHKSFR